MKHEKKYEIMGLLDDRIYEEVLQKREELTRGGVHRTGNRLRRMLLIAACVALLAVGVMAAFLPAMLSDPGVDTPPTAESESTPSPGYSISGWGMWGRHSLRGWPKKKCRCEKLITSVTAMATNRLTLWSEGLSRIV